MINYDFSLAIEREKAANVKPEIGPDVYYCRCGLAMSDYVLCDICGKRTCRNCINHDNNGCDICQYCQQDERILT